MGKMGRQRALLQMAAQRFEQSLAGAESIVKLTHQLGERLSVVARGGTNNAVDLFYTFTFR